MVSTDSSFPRGLALRGGGEMSWREKLGDSTTCEYTHGNDAGGTVTVPLVTDAPVSCLVTHPSYGERTVLVERA